MIWETGPGVVYWGTPPRCPVHGQMNRQDAMCRWVCHGYDGEGCEHAVTDEQVMAEAKPLGTTAGGTFGLYEFGEIDGA